MISQASSKKTKNNFPYAFRTAFSAGALFALLEAIMMIFAFVFLPLMDFIGMNKDFARRFSTTGVLEKISDSTVFSLCPSADIIVPLVTFGTIALSIVLGVKMFRFITNKKTVNVYYSLGIKRVSLFSARYFAGLLMLVGGIFLSFMMSIIINIAFIGSSSALWQAAIFNAVSFSVLAAVCYTATAAVFSCVGTMFEGGIFTAVLLAIPSIFLYGLETLSRNFLFGSPYGQSYANSMGEYVRHGSLVSQYAAFSPFSFINTLVSVVQSATPGENGEVLNIFGEAWDAPSYGLLIIWAAVTAVLFFVGIFTFQRRKAEICGFVGMSKILNAAVIFIIGFLGFSLCINSIEFLGNVGCILLGVAVFTVIYTAAQFFFLRSFKLFFKSLWKLPIHLTAAIVIALCFVTGGFGYSEKIPAASDIKSVSINTLALDDRVAVSGEYYSGFTFSADSAPVRTFASALTGEFTSAKDIDRIIELQKKYIGFKGADKEGEKIIRVPMFFVYTLKDGSSFTRYFEVADYKTVFDTAALCDSDFMDSIISECFTTDIKAVNYDEKQSDYEFNRSALVYGVGKVYAASSMLSTTNEMTLTKEQHTQLKACIAKDLLNQDAAAYLTPSKPAMGIIWFHTNIEDEDASYEVTIGGDSLTDKQLPISVSPTSLTGNSAIYLTPDMTETLAFLDKNGFMPLFEEKAEIKSVSFIKGFYNRANSYSFPTLESVSTPDLKQFFWQEKFVLGENEITDGDKIKQLNELSHLKYLTDGTGYRCYFTLSDGRIVEKYLTEEAAPDYVKNFSYGSTGFKVIEE